MCQRRRVAYIEFARTSPALHYKGVNVHKVVALLVTLVIKCYDDHKSYLMTDR